jgi:hypothetical protein
MFVSYKEQDPNTPHGTKYQVTAMVIPKTLLFDDFGKATNFKT